MKVKIWIVADGGCNEAGAKAFLSYEEAYAYMKELYGYAMEDCKEAHGADVSRSCIDEHGAWVYCNEECPLLDCEGESPYTVYQIVEQELEIEMEAA